MPTFNIDGKSYTLPDGFSPEENQAMLKQMMGSGDGGQNSSGQSGGVGTITDPNKLSYDPAWMKNTASLYEYNFGKKFVGNDQQLSDWGVTQMRFMNNNLAVLAVDTARIHQAPQNIKNSYVDMMETYDKIDYTWGGAAEAAGAQALDPSNWSGLLTLGIGTAAAGGAKIAGKSALKELLKTGIKTGIQTGIENAAQNAAMDAAQQTIKIDAGRQKEFSTSELATSAGVGAVAGGALGVASPFVGAAAKKGKDALAAIVGKDAAKVVDGDAGKVAGDVVKPVDQAAPEAPQTVPDAPKAPDEASPQAAPEQVQGNAPNASNEIPANPSEPAPKADTGEAPKADASTPVDNSVDPKVPAKEVQPEGGEALATQKPFGTESDQLELFPDNTRVQTEPKIDGEKVSVINGEKKLTDNPVYNAIVHIANNDGGRTFPTSKADIGKAVDTPTKILEGIAPQDIKLRIEELRRAYTTGQERQIVDQTIQAATENLLKRNSEISKQLADVKLDVETRNALIVERDKSYEIEQALRLADLDQSSMAGANLGSRAGNINTGDFRNVSAESLLKEKGIQPELATEKEWADAKDEYYKKLIEHSDRKEQDSRVVDLKQQAQTALDKGDFKEASMRMAEADAIISETTGGFSVTKATAELMISNVFSPKSFIVNVVPSVIQLIFRPAFAAFIKMDGKAVREMITQYTVMSGHMNFAWKAAKASFDYERSLISGNVGLGVSSQAIPNKLGGRLFRLIPRMNTAADEFASQLNYRMFVSADAAGRAYDNGIANGLSGQALQDYVKAHYTKALEDAFTPGVKTSAVQFLRQEGTRRGLSGAKLDEWVTTELHKNSALFREATSQMGKNFADDAAFKRDFRGHEGNGLVTGTVSNLAGTYEEFLNRNPILKIFTNMFYRTPLRVFEAGFRLTSGLNLVSPGFLRDLTGKGFGGIGGYAQTRAQGELFLSSVLTTAAFYLYSQGRLHGSGQYGLTDYKNAEQMKQGGFQPYSIKIGDTYWSFQNVDPLATPFKIIANGLDRMNMNATRQAQGENLTKSDWEALAYVKVAGLSIAQAVKDAGFTQGINDIFKLADDFSDPDRNSDSIMKFLGKKLQMLVPNTISKVEGVFDNSVRDPSGLLDYLEVKFAPGLVVKKYDATGHEIKNANPWTGIYGFPDLTSQSQIDANYGSKTHQEAMKYLAQVGLSTNKNFTPNYDIAKFAGSKSDFNLKNLEGNDLRQMKTHNGLSYWDRLNQILASSGLDKRLVDISKSKAPVGTPSNPAWGLKQIVNTLEQSRHDALEKLLQEERPYNLDFMKQNDVNRQNKLDKKIADKSGQHEASLPFQF